MGKYITYSMRIGNGFFYLSICQKSQGDTMIEKIIEQFRLFLLNNQITQESAAKQLSITQEHLSRIIHGKRTPSTALLIRMEKYMENK